MMLRWWEGNDFSYVMEADKFLDYSAYRITLMISLEIIYTENW